MSKQALAALEVERARAIELAQSLSDEEWATPSDCDGWRVQDVFAHMATVFHQVADPSATPPDASGDAEATAELMLAPLKDLTPEQVLAEYVEWGDKAHAALVGLQEPPMADTVIPLGNLGEHPLHLLANAFVFDHYCHLRHDVLAPGGPIEREPLPQDEASLAATMEWMLAGLPQMCAAPLEPLVDRPVNLVFEGPGGGSWVLVPGPLRVEEGSSPDAVATVTSTPHDFVSWGTQRRDWRESGVTIAGDEAYAGAVLDAFNVI